MALLPLFLRRTGATGVFCFHASALLLGLCLTLPPGVQAQEAGDTLRTYEMEPVVITADRAARQLFTSTAAVSVLHSEELQRIPMRTLADALETIPGFAFLSLDGLGLDPQTTIRGFYGGGEAEYVVMLVNGRPVNGLERGLINWNMLPLDAVTAVEVLRGGASSLYGDAAIGGVINLITEAGTVPRRSLSVSGGSFQTFEGRLSASGTWQGRRYAVQGGGLQSDGYREHAERQYADISGSLDALASPTAVLTLSTLNHWRGFDVPGPLSSEISGGAAIERKKASAFYRFDHTDEQFNQVALDGRLTLSSVSALTASLTGELRKAEAAGTVVLSADFADTQLRNFDTRRVLGTVQLTMNDLGLPLETSLVAGIDASAGGFDNTYHALQTGSFTDYAQSTGVAGDLFSKGEATRRALAAYAQLEAVPLPALRLTLGGRYDALEDGFTAKDPGTADKLSTSHTAFSPKAGLNLRYLAGAHQVGNLYANVSASFKTPTLDQLFDQRGLPVPFPPFSISLSNAGLKPQQGTSYEVGFYHRADLSPGRLGAALSVSVYQMDMRNELDFNLETLSYVNLGKSRHRGIEAGLKVFGARHLSGFLNYTYQGVTLEYGDNDGKFVKAIPRDLLTAGVAFSPAQGLGGSLKVRAARRIFLDDANTINLDGNTTVDGRLQYRFLNYAAHLDVFNFFDALYWSTGFPDPAGSEQVFLYPAAGRHLRLGVSLSF